jgi:class 3 adenylate cyclase
MSTLTRFLSPKVSDLIMSGDADDPLKTRRREITVVFVDLRGFTAFTETAEPEEVMGVLREYHAELGRDYGAVGTVTNLAARLCGEAKDGQILISPRIFSKVESIEAEPVGELTLKGFHRPVFAHNVLGVRS